MEINDCARTAAARNACIVVETSGALMALVTSKGVRACRLSEMVLDLLDNPVQSFIKEDGEAVTRAKG